MSVYLLDTNILIDLAGPQTSRGFILKQAQLPDVAFATSIICVAEFFGGANTVERRWLETWLRSTELQIVYLDQLDDAYVIGELRQQARFRMADAMIVQAARKIGATLLTADRQLAGAAGGLVPVVNPLTP